jgi:hypothetical protein
VTASGILICTQFYGLIDYKSKYTKKNPGTASLRDSLLHITCNSFIVSPYRGGDENLQNLFVIFPGIPSFSTTLDSF